MSACPSDQTNDVTKGIVMRSIVNQESQLLPFPAEQILEII